MRHNSSVKNTRKLYLRTILLATAGIAPIVMSATIAQAQNNTQVQAKTFNIPAQSLSDALVLFGKQSGYQVTADGAAVNNVRTHGVNGTMAPVKALSQLLLGTGFTYRVNGNVVSIEPAPQSADGTIQLGPVRVEGTGGNGDGGVVYNSELTKTENTGSYTTKAMTLSTGVPTSIRETPQSVTVITSQLMEDKQINDFVDVVENTVGLSVSRYESNRGSMYARGFKIENFLVNGVPTSIDEQWSAGEVLNNTVIYDHIEILRGSDGLMVGTGNPSAIVNMVRKRADSKTLTGSFSAELGSWSHYGGTFDISGPLSKSGKTRGRFVADYDTNSSYVDRLENKGYVLFGTVEQDIGERTLVSAGISYQDNQTDSPTWGGVPAWTVDSSSNVIRLDIDKGFNTSTDWSYWESDYTNAFLSVEHKLENGWNFKANYTHGERNSESKLVLFYSYPIDPDNGKSFMPFYGFKIPTAGYAGKYYVENIKDDINVQLDGKVQLLNREHDLAFGFDLSREHFVADGAPANITIANVPNIFEFNGSSPEPTYIARQNYKDHKITQNAIYASGRFTLADPLKLILGTRLINYRVTDNKAPANNFKSVNKLVPYAGVVYDVTKNFSAYASYTTIFQPQNYRDDTNKLLEPIEGNTYEAGVKAEFFDGRLNAALSVYKMEQDNVGKYDRTVPENPNNPTGPQRSAYIAVDGVTSKGFEFEVNGEITPNWNVFAGYSQTEAEEPDGTAINSLVPEKQFNVFTTYQLPGAWKKLTIGGGVRWQSEVYTHQAIAAALGVPKLEQESYYVADLMARYKINDQLSAQLNINNVLDEDYFAPTQDGMQVFWQAPRNAELKIKYQF